MSTHEVPREQMDLFKENPDPAVVAEMLRVAEERKKAALVELGSSPERASVVGQEKLAGTHCSRCDTERDAKGYCNCNRQWGGERVS